MLLMCKNVPVYDTDKEQVLNEQLLPGLLKRNHNYATFYIWLKYRYSSNTNSIARQLQGLTFRQGNRMQIDKDTHALSLIDCYWLTQDTSIRFEDISPYYTKFWTGQDTYEGGAIPTLYVGGFLTKEWRDKENLFKSGAQIEVECSRLAGLCNIPCAEICATKGGILVKNITSPDIMLEQADMSGNFDPDNFSDSDIINAFGIDGFNMILLDAVFGNGDRHAGNFAYFRDTNTGAYLGLSKLYDFDHAKDSTLEFDILIRDLLKPCLLVSEYKDSALRVLDIISKNTNEPVFKQRADALTSLLLDSIDRVQRALNFFRLNRGTVNCNKDAFFLEHLVTAETLEFLKNNGLIQRIADDYTLTDKGTKSLKL